MKRSRKMDTLPDLTSSMCVVAHYGLRGWGLAAYTFGVACVAMSLGYFLGGATYVIRNSQDNDEFST